MKSKHTAFRSVDFKELPIAALRPHPEAEKIPMDDEDSASLMQSVADFGVMDPPKVMADGEGYLIVDGVNRWKSALAGQRETMMCQVIETDEPEKVVATCLSAGRKRTTGQRVFCFLEANKYEALAAYQLNAEKGEIFRKLSKLSRECLADWKSKKIAEKLRCGQEDVLAGLEHLDCVVNKLTLPDRDTMEREPADTDYLDALMNIRRRIYEGSLPIRHWKSALTGKRKTADGRGPTDYTTLATRSLTSLGNVFDHWDDVAAAEKAGIVSAFRAMLKGCPKELLPKELRK